MALCQTTFYSQALGKQTSANIIVPEGDAAAAPWSVMYLLHGLSDDHTIWCRRTSVERYVEGLPLMVVMPNGDRGFYTDADEGFAYETAIARDLVAFIDRTFATRPERMARCIGGLSMGGYGSVHLALRHPDLFCSAVSHSGALAFGHTPVGGDDEFSREFRRVIGDHPANGRHDLFALASDLSPELRPALRIDCGLDDLLLADNRAYHAHLDSIGYPHEYQESPGAHEWAYWDLHVQEAIAFHCRHLDIQRAG